MKDGVDLTDCRIAPIHLLAEISGCGGMVSVLTDEVSRMHEHPAAAAGGIVDGVTRTRFKNAHERVHYFRRGEEFPRLRARVVGELLDEVLVSPAEDVGWHVLVRQ